MRKVTFTNARQESIELGYHTPYLINKIEGLGQVDADMGMVSAPYQDGQIFIDTKLSPREINIEGTFRKLTSPELYNNRKQMQRLINPKLGLGTLQYEHEGVLKQIDAVADGTPVFPDKDTDMFQRFQVDFICPNPYWRDLNQVSRALRAYEGKFTLPFTLPFRLGKQGDRTTLTNDGDVPAPVQIDLQGPVTNPKITNETTGEFIQINGSIAADEVLHIDTTPNMKRIEVYKGDFVRSIFGRFAYEQGASFWKLEIGKNDISYVADEGNNKAIVAVSWRNMYSGI